MSELLCAGSYRQPLQGNCILGLPCCAEPLADCESPVNFLESAPAEHARVPIIELSKTEMKVFQIRKTVLLAEDNDDLRYVMELSLRAMGYHVVACADAHLASMAFHSHPAIDLLMTDFEMPNKTGLELARELTVSSPALPVMIITGSLLPEATMQEIQERRWTYLSKPCHLTALESTMKAVMAAELPANA